ncbi:MAG TPA: hypothetical protein VFQ91_05760 [Bryobacteraceae bacterium]|nr:hypothetical protein [Bryobacteraceae bacterium]
MRKLTRMLTIAMMLCAPVSMWGAAAKKHSKVPHRTGPAVVKASKATAKGTKAVGKGSARVSDHAIEGTIQGGKAIGRGMKWLVT